LGALAQSLARPYGPKGIHIAHVILDGIVDTTASHDLHSWNPSRLIKPEEIALTYLALVWHPKST